MNTYIVLLRAVNVGGLSLPMERLRQLANDCGLQRPRTLIQSGNLLVDSELEGPEVQRRLESALAQAVAPIPVLLRTGPEVRQVLADNPFPEIDPKKLLIMFLPAPVEPQEVVGPAGEEVRFHGRELFVHYPEGMGRSKLKLPWADQGTGRNLNTVARLVAML